MGLTWVFETLKPTSSHISPRRPHFKETFFSFLNTSTNWDQTLEHGPVGTVLFLATTYSLLKNLPPSSLLSTALVTSSVLSLSHLPQDMGTMGRPIDSTGSRSLLKFFNGDEVTSDLCQRSRTAGTVWNV